MAHIMAVGARFLLGLPQGVDLPHRLRNLKVQRALHLLQTSPLALLTGQAAHEEQIGCAANKGHELHHDGRAGRKKIGIDPGGEIEGIIQQRNHAELNLGNQRHLRNHLHGRRCTEQKQQQRQRNPLKKHLIKKKNL